MTNEAPPPGRGGRLSRRVAVKLKPGPRNSEARTITPKARSKMLKISRIAAMLVHDGVWPSPKAVAEKAADLPIDTVKRYIAALDPARRLWVARFGRHPHWDDPEAVEFAGAVADGDAVAAGLAANDDVPGDQGGTDGGTDAADGTTGGRGVTAPGRSDAGASADDPASLLVELDLAGRRVDRLIGELAAERAAHADTRTELDNEREISARLLKGFRGPSLVYTEADAELTRRTK